MIMEPLMAAAAEATDMLRVGRSRMSQLIAARQRESIKIGRSQRASVASTTPHRGPAFWWCRAACSHECVSRPARVASAARITSVQGLDLGFLVDAEHDRVLRRVEVLPDHTGYLGDHLWIGGELERTPLSNYIDALH
jgi:hypothetical protein